jgi:hypothetical protein
MSNTMTPRQLRGKIAESREPLYQIAAAAEIHPSRLSAMLHERVPLPGDVTARVLAALDRHATKTG